MDVQDLNKACELAFLVAREGVEQDPPIDPPAPMRMFLYVRDFPQRALTVARQVLAEDEEFRRRVAVRASAESVGETALAWLNQAGVLQADEPSIDGHEAEEAAPAAEPPVTKESIQSELAELKSLVGQLSEERQAVDEEVHELERSLSEPGPAMPEIEADPVALASSSLVTQIRNLHADLKQARMERDHAQESRELAIIEQAELTAQLEQLRTLATSTENRLGELESRIVEMTAARETAEAERQSLEAERAELVARAESIEGERDHLAAEREAIARDRAAVEDRLAVANADLERLNAELDDARTNAGASVSELRAALAASEMLTAQVEELSEVQRASRLEMERVNAALADQTMSSADKINLLEAALNQVAGERDALARKLELVRTAVSSVQTGVATLDSSVADAESAADVLGTRVQDLRTSVEDLRAEPIDPGDLRLFDVPDLGELVDPVEPGETEESPVDGEAVGTAGPLLLSAPPVDGSQPEVGDSVDGFEGDGSVDGTDEADGPVVTGLRADDDSGVAPESASSVEANLSDLDGMSPHHGREASGAATDIPVDTTGWSVDTFGGAAPHDAPTEDLDEVHALVAEAVASFEPDEEDALPGAGLDAETAAQAVGPVAQRGGLASLFSSFVPQTDEAEEILPTGLLDDRTEPNDEGEPAVDIPPAAVADPDGEAADGPERTPITVPEDLASDPVGMARYVVQTEDAVLLVDGDPVAALGWPTVERVDQRRNLVHFLHALAGSSGVAPDVLLDRDHGIDRLPDSRTVRVRVTEEAGSVAAQILGLIDSYPLDWPVVVVTDDRDLAAEAGMKGATVLDNGQLLDLFIAS